MGSVNEIVISSTELYHHTRRGQQGQEPGRNSHQPPFRSAASAPKQCGARRKFGPEKLCCKPATQRPDGGDLDCGGRAQRRHRLPSVALLPKAAWRSASRRSPYPVAASPPFCRPASGFGATRHGQCVRDYVPAIAEKPWTFSRLQPEPTRRVARR